jgi:hypothetical protein
MTGSKGLTGDCAWIIHCLVEKPPKREQPVSQVQSRYQRRDSNFRCTDHLPDLLHQKAYRGIFFLLLPTPSINSLLINNLPVSPGHLKFAPRNRNSEVLPILSLSLGLVAIFSNLQLEAFYIPPCSIQRRRSKFSSHVSPSPRSRYVPQAAWYFHRPTL